MKRHLLAGGALAFCIAGFGLPVLADESATTIHAVLKDNGSSALDKLGEIKPMGMDMGGDAKMATMHIELDTHEVKAGEITIEAQDASQDFIHELIVAPLNDPTKPLPYNVDDNGVDEDAAHAIGEVSELDAGASGKVTLHLGPGEYILFCNVPGHYAMGMWTVLKVDA